MNIVFFDTETTGKEEKGRLVSLAFIGEDELGKQKCLWNALYKPPVPIEVEAMAIHHITNKMVENEESFEKRQPEVKTLFEAIDTYCVAHNAEFDVAMLRKEGINPSNVICTLKVARFLDKEGKIPSHSLQYLRYFLDLDVGEVQAHDAMGDVVVLRALFARLKAKMLEMGFDDTYAEMVRISKEPSLIPRFSFGKYKGELISSIAKRDAGYLRWLQDSEQQKGETADKDMLHTISYHLNPQIPLK